MAAGHAAGGAARPESRSATASCAGPRLRAAEPCARAGAGLRVRDGPTLSRCCRICRLARSARLLAVLARSFCRVDGAPGVRLLAVLTRLIWRTPAGPRASWSHSPAARAAHRRDCCRCRRRRSRDRSRRGRYASRHSGRHCRRRRRSRSRECRRPGRRPQIRRRRATRSWWCWSRPDRRPAPHR